MASNEHFDDPRPPAASFCTTNWNLVLEAVVRNSNTGDAALAELCRIYWYPVYSYIRRRGQAHPDAEDLTQEFFSQLLQKEYLKGVERNGGRFRSYLLTTLKHFLTNQWERAQAQKRGGGKVIVSLDGQDAESRYEIDAADPVTPDRYFERQWMQTLLHETMRCLEQEYRLVGRQDIFARLQPFLSGDKNLVPYAELANQTGVSESAIKVAVHRLRKRYGEIVRDQVARTVAHPEEIEDEIRCLMGVASRL